MADEKPLDLLVALLRDLEGESLKPKTMRKAVALRNWIATLSSANETPISSGEVLSEQGAHRTRKPQPGRHDKPQLPAGHRLLAGTVVPESYFDGSRYSEPESETVETARTIAVNVLRLFMIDDLTLEVGAALETAKPKKIPMKNSSAWLQKANEQRRIANGELRVLRKPKGKLVERQRWELSLASELEWAARSRIGVSFSRERYGTAFGAETSSSAQILSRMYGRPPELTAEAIDGMLEKVGLNAGGAGGKKTAQAVVDEFVDFLNARKSRKK